MVNPNSHLAPGPADPERGGYRVGALMSLLQLHWFIRLRWVFVGAALAVIVGERWMAPTVSRPAGLFALLFLLAFINVVWTVLSRYMMQVIERGQRGEAFTVRQAIRFSNLQVAVDLLLLTGILRFTGGVENPMMIFYLFHMVIASLLLPSGHAVGQGIWAIVLYAGLGMGELSGWITPHQPLFPRWIEVGLYQQPAWVFSVLVIQTAGVLGTLYFTIQIASRLDEREGQLWQAHVALHKSEMAIRDLQLRRSRFMQTAAHQLKSPLSGIQTLTALIRDRIVSGDAVMDICEKIIRRCRDGIQQVTELLTLARVQEADPKRHGAALTDAGKMVQELYLHFKPLAEAKHIAFHARVREGPDLHVRVDPADLRDCLSNLIDNAIKYTPEYGTVIVMAGRGLKPCRNPKNVPRSGTASSEIQDDFVFVSVRDTGMGIEPESLGDAKDPARIGSIFDDFRRGNRVIAAGIPGTGLGLSIVREIVEQAHGRIRVVSRVGEGSTFTVVFPAQGRRQKELEVRDTRAGEFIFEDRNL